MSDPQLFPRISNEDIGETCARFFDVCRRSGCVYRTPGPDGDVLFVTPEDGPRPIRTIDGLMGVLPQLVRVTRPVNQNGTLTDVSGRFSGDELRYIFNSGERKILPVIRATVHQPVVYLKASGTLQVTHPGYNAEPEVFYWQDPSELPIAPSSGVEHLITCFSGVPFADKKQRANIIAYLVASTWLDRSLETPLLSITGNQQNIGKTSLALAVGHILTGSMPTPLDTPRGEEFGKQISTRINEGSRFILVDNIVRRDGRAFNSPQLAKMLTEGYSKRVRVLGQSRTVSQDGVLFAITMNDGKLDTDLSTRSLSVKLFAEKSKPMTPFVRDYAVKYRREIYAELLGLALSMSTVTETDEFSHFRFRQWLSFSLPRIKPHFGELEIGSIDTLDEISQEIFSYGFDRLGAEFTAQQFVSAITQGPINGDNRFPALAERLMACSSNAGRHISAGRLLTQYVDQPGSPAVGRSIALRLLRGARRDEGALYRFEDITPAVEDVA